MNAVPNSATDFIEENASGSDSDSNAGDSPEYYQPLSAVVGDEEEDDFSDQNSDDDHNQNPNCHSFSNGYVNCVENGVASLDLTDEEEERMPTVESESAIRRAFREDESRRNAPLPPENATRVMEAMRGISFGGIVPNWANAGGEDLWIDQLRRLRQTSPSAGNNRATW